MLVFFVFHVSCFSLLSQSQRFNFLRSKRFFVFRVWYSIEKDYIDLAYCIRGKISVRYSRTLWCLPLTPNLDQINLALAAYLLAYAKSNS